MADEPTVRRGDEGEWVTYLQQVLQHLSIGTADVDGTFGDTTEDAVRQFQQANGLESDGIVAAQTWEALTRGSGGTDGEQTGQPGAGDDGTGDVPEELVALGAPRNLSEWTAEQRQGYFVGKDPIEEVGGDADDAIEVAEITDAGNDGESYA